MKIAFLATGIIKERKEATKITLISLSRYLKRAKHKVIIATDMRKGLKSHEKIENVDIYRSKVFNSKIKFLSNINRSLSQISALKKASKDIKSEFDIIHGFGSAPLLGLLVYLAKKHSKSAKKIFTVKSYSKSIMGSFIFSRTLNLMDKVTVPTKIFAKKLIRNGVKKNKIIIIPSHIDTKKFKPMNKAKLKQKYGYAGKKIILYYGAMWDKKGTDILAESIHDIIKKEKNAFFIFAPRNIPYANRYDKLFEKLKINKFCKIIKEDINIVEYVNLADVVALPYLTMIGTEANPSCMLESMACKTAIVTTNHPELREIVQHEKEVLMAIPKNKKSLVENTVRILKDKKLYKKITTAAHKKAQEFHIEKISRKYIKLYKELIT